MKIYISSYIHILFTMHVKFIIINMYINEFVGVQGEIIMKLSKRKLLAIATVAALFGSQGLIVQGAASLSNGMSYANNGSKLNISGSLLTAGVEVDTKGSLEVGQLNSNESGTYRKSFITVAGDGKLTTGGGTMLPSSGVVAYVTSGVANFGYNSNGMLSNQPTILEGDMVVGVPHSTSGDKSVINIALTNSDSLWVGLGFNNTGDNGEINVTLQNGAQWDHMYNGASSSLLNARYSSTSESHINRLVGTDSRDYNTSIIQSEHNPIRIDQMSGHMNFYINHNKPGNDDEPLRDDQKTDGQKSSDFWGGNIYIKSATPGSVAHVMTPVEGIDISDENKVNTALNNLAGKVFYTNYVTGERNLTGTVGFVSEGAQSALFKVITDDKAKEGAITWQADKKGQGKYDSEAPTDPTTPISPTQPQEPATPVTPVNPGNNGIQQGDYDTPHMRGVRGAVLSNIGAFRMMTDDMYRTRTLQQGAPVGIWANINTGRYDFSTTGVSNESEYTRFRGGFDKQFGTLIVGGQIEYLRGDDDFNDTGAIRSGSGKERAFMGGIYATKDIGNDAYVHIETKAGRLSNDFTVYNEVGNALSGKTSSTAYSVAARVGKQVKFNKALYVEPQAQLAYMHLSGDSFNAGSMHVNQSSVNSTVGKLGVEVGKLFGAGNLYTRFSVGHAFTGNVETTYTSGSTVKTTDTDIKGSWTELAFGGRYGLNANNSIFVDVSAGLSGDYKQHWGFNAGFSHKF